MVPLFFFFLFLPVIDSELKVKPTQYSYLRYFGQIAHISLHSPELPSGSVINCLDGDVMAVRQSLSQVISRDGSRRPVSPKPD